MNRASRQVKATEMHLVLLRDLAEYVHDFMQQNQQMDVIEVISVLGSVAGAFISNAPVESERTRARQSVINSMDSAITDFMAARTPGAGRKQLELLEAEARRLGPSSPEYQQARILRAKLDGRKP